MLIQSRACSQAVGGMVGPMTTEGVTQSFSYSLTGVDTACGSGAGSAANSCGVHIHSGMTCGDNAGGHYFTGTVTSDPWTSIAYTSVAGEAKGVVTVMTGATWPDIEGRAMIIHGFDGGRIACALIEPVRSVPPAMASDFVKYYTYDGPWVSCSLVICEEQ